MDTLRSWVAVIVLLAVVGCTGTPSEGEESLITPIGCEETQEGDLICEGAAAPSQFCVYNVRSFRGADCPTPEPSQVCVKCAAGQRTCPSKQALVYKTGDCRVLVLRAGSSCTRCPRGGLTVEVADD